MSEDRLPPQDAALTMDDSSSMAEESRRRRRRIMMLLRGRYPWAITAALLLGIAGAVGGYFSQGDQYRSTGRLEMNPVLPTPAGGERKVSGQWDQWLATKALMMTSPPVISAAMASEDWKKAAHEAGVQYGQVEFARQLAIRRHGESNLLDASFTASHPKVAAAGINAALNAYVKVFRNREQESDVQVLRILQDQKAKLSDELSRYTAQRNSMAGQYGVETIKPQYEAQFREMTNLQSELNQVRRQLGAVGGGPAELASYSKTQLIAMDAQLADLDQQRQDLNQQIQRYKLNGYGSSYRAVRQAKSSLSIIEQKIAERVRQLRSGKAPLSSPGTQDTGANQLQQQAKFLSRQLAQAKRSVKNLGGKLKQVQDINAQIQKTKNDLTQVENRIQQKNSASMISGRVQIQHGGVIPTEAVNAATRIRYAALLGVVGMALGVGGVMLVGLLDPRLRHIEETENDLPAARLLGVVPTLPENGGDKEQTTVAAHAVHNIRTLLQIKQAQGKVFSITSPAAASGKTSLTMALGLSFAASGAKTLLIDADIVGGGLTRRTGFAVHPRLGRVLQNQGLICDQQINDALRVAQTSGVKIGEALVDLGYVSSEDVQQGLEQQEQQSIGLLDASGDGQFEHCIAPTGVEGLSLLPIGKALPEQAGSLSPTALRRTIAQARRRFDTVLIDTGPLLGSLEASMAAAEADATLMIVSRGNQKPLISKCVQTLQRIGGTMAGIVFNHALRTDIIRSTYGSVTMSQERRVDQPAAEPTIDPDTSARFGPIATAVASHAGGNRAEAASDRRMAAVGSTNGENHVSTNGHAS